MVRVLFLFLTCFHVNVARSNGNPTWRAFQSYDVMLQFVFLFTFNGVLIVFERRKKSRIDKDTKTRCNL